MTKIETDAAAMAAADEIVTLTNSLSKLNADMEGELQDIRGRYAPEITLLQGRIKEQTKALSTYTTRKGVAERLFAGGKSATSQLAVFGWRDSAPTVKPLDTKQKLEDVAVALQERGLFKYITLPEPKPTINRAAVMAENPDAASLAALGLRQVVTSTFYVDLRDKLITKETTVKA